MKLFFRYGLFVVAIIGLILIHSCKKTEESSIPIIKMVSPIENEIFALPDSITIDCHISDSREITSVKIQLVDEDFTPVLQAYYFYPNTTETSIHFKYSLDKLLAETGKYYLLVRADNENRFKNNYQAVFITAISQTLKQLLIITATSDTILEVSGFNSNDDPYLLFNINGDYSDSDISNQNQLLFVAGKNSLNVAAFDIHSGDEIWRIPDIVYNPMHNNNCLHYFEGTLYTSTNYQYIYGYDPTGKITFDAFIDNTDAPGTIFGHQEFVLVDFQKKTPAQPSIKTYYAGTGAEKQSRLSSYQVIDFFSYSNELVVVCATEGSFGKVMYYDLQNNSITEIFNFDSPIRCVSKINNVKILVGLENSFYELSLETGSAVILQQDVSYSVIRYEVLSDQVFLASGNQLLIFTYPEMEYQKTVLFSDTILDILLNYSI